MGRRCKPLCLKRICLSSIARNMEKLWCADYYNNYYDQGTFLHVLGPFVCLPGDMLQELVRYLGVQGWMKRYYLHVLIDGRMERLDLSLCKKAANKDSIINLVTARCHKLVSVNLSACNQVSSRVLSDMVQALTHLTSLTLRHTKCTDQVLSQIGQSCSRLRELDVYGCPVTDMGIMSLCVSFHESRSKVPHLYKLDIAFTAVTHKAVDIVLANCKNMHFLHYPDTCAAVYHMDKRGVFDTDVYTHELVMRTLYLSQMKEPEADDNESVRISCIRCPCITEVYIHRGVTDPGVLHLTTLSNLSVLHLTNDMHEDITFENGLLPLLQVTGKNIQELVLCEINFLDIGAIGCCCPNLRTLSCLIAGYQSAFFPLHSHPEITAVSNLKAPFQHLEELNISIYTEENNFPEQFTRLLLINATKLRNLQFVQVQQFTDELFVKILEQNPFQKLQNLCLERCNGINLDSIYDFCEATTNDLVKLSLKLCRSISRIDKEQLDMLVEESNLDLTIEWS